MIRYDMIYLTANG